MAIAVVPTSENKTANGTITIPAGTTRIIALVKGSTATPVIGSKSMSKIYGIEASGIMPAISAHEFIVTTVGTVSFTFTGIFVQFIYLSGADTFRAGGLIGQSTTGSSTGNLVTTTTDLVLGMICGSIGPTALTGDTVALTYLLNNTLDKIGYITPGDTSLTCVASDSGVSAGYWVDGGTLHHDAVLVTAGYTSYDAVWNEGYYETVTVTTPGYYQKNHVWVADTWITHGVWPFQWKELVPGHWWDYYSWVEPVTSQEQVWHNGYYTYPPVWHDPVYDPAYDEDLPDTWVPGGTAASISALFISIKVAEAAVSFVPPVIFFG